MIILLILNIIFRAAKVHTYCLPFYQYRFGPNIAPLISAPASNVNVNNVNWANGDDGWWNSANAPVKWCGNSVLIYVTNGIMLGLLVIALLLAVMLLR